MKIFRQKYGQIQRAGKHKNNQQNNVSKILLIIRMIIT